MDITVRGAIEPISPTVAKASKPAAVEEGASAPVMKGSTPPTLYSEVEGLPYLAKHYEVEKIYDTFSNETKDNVQNIEAKFRAQVHSGMLDNTDKAFTDYIRKLEGITDTKNAPFMTKMGVISEYLYFQDRAKHFTEGIK